MKLVQSWSVDGKLWKGLKEFPSICPKSIPLESLSTMHIYGGFRSHHSVFNPLDENMITLDQVSEKRFINSS